MKRSQINAALRAGIAFFEKMHFYLPPFAHWEPRRWSECGPECRDLLAQQLGWDITDFGSGDFARCGLLLFTLRNGSRQELAAGTGKSYAEKIMMVGEEQVTPAHTHFFKMEDIINRGGGALLVRLWNDGSERSRSHPALADSEVVVRMDGIEHRLAAGATICLEPGCSITLEPGHYHSFWGAPGRGPVLVGEVSRVNDDREDNIFLDGSGRFPSIEEDEAPLRLLVGDYPAGPAGMRRLDT